MTGMTPNRPSSKNKPDPDDAKKLAHIRIKPPTGKKGAQKSNFYFPDPVPLGRKGRCTSDLFKNQIMKGLFQ